MNAIVSLCHFCELHGPKILFCTQPFHPHDNEAQTDVENEAGGEMAALPPRVMSPSSFPPEAQTPVTPTGHFSLPHFKNDLCVGCTSVHFGFVSNDDDAEVSYVSSQRPHHRDVFSMIRQACIRSLSCEVCPGREGPIFFGDEQQGYAISYTFYIKDNQARGFQRLYSIIVVMMDKIYLLNSWPFLVENIKIVVHHLQGKAEKVYIEEQVTNPQKHPRLSCSINPKNYIVQRGGNKPARSLIELTDDKHIFKILHTSFVWLLKVCGSRLSESLLEGPPTEDSIIDMEKQEVTEEGFVYLFSKKVEEVDVEEALEVQPGEDSQSELKEVEEELDSPSVHNIRHLMKLLGHSKFNVLAHHVVIGNQIIVRGQGKMLVKSILSSLKSLLPKGCYRPVLYSQTYVESYKCNLLGLSPDISIPAHVHSSEIFLLLDVYDPPSDHKTRTSRSDPLDGYTFKLSSPVKLAKAPSVLSRMELAIHNDGLTDEVVEQCLICLKEEWMNNVKVLFKFTKAGGNRSEDDTRKLLQVVGAKQEDKPLLMYWMTGLSVQYKNHILSASMQKQGT